MESTVKSVLLFSTMLSPVLFNDGNDETPREPENKWVLAVPTTTQYDDGSKMKLGSVAMDDPSVNFQPFRLIGFAERLNNSINSASGKPRTGDGSAMNSLITTSL